LYEVENSAEFVFLQVTMDTSLGNLSLMLNTDHYVVITHDQRYCEFYIHLHLSSFFIYVTYSSYSPQTKQAQKEKNLTKNTKYLAAV